MIEQLIARVFSARNIAHFHHLTSQSHADHKALGEFYESIVPAVDSLVECYIGQFGQIDDLPNVDSEVKNLVEFLRDEADWIEVNRNEIANDSAAIGNLIDNLTALYLRTIYRMENLK